MPYPNEHSAVLTSPEGYDTFRRQNNKFAKGVHAVFGIKKGPPRKSELHSIRFSVSMFTAAEAKKWLKDHDISYSSFEAASGKKSALSLDSGLSLNPDESLSDVPVVAYDVSKANSSYGKHCIRSAHHKLDSLSEEDRSVEMLLVTEEPIPLPDWSRGELIPEMLLMSGLKLSKETQLPLLDSHKRDSLDSILGSVRDLRKTKDGLVGRAYFSASSDGVWEKVKEGHITDVSVGYRYLKHIFVPKGEKATLSGREFVGPLNVVTAWEAVEVSLTAAGADPRAKLRSATLNDKIRALMVAKGLPEDATEEASLEWLASLEPPEPNPKPNHEPTLNVADIAAQVRLEIRKAIDERAEAQRKFRVDGLELCKRYGFSPAEADVMIRSSADIAELKSQLLDRVSERQKPLHVSFGEEQADKHHKAMQSAFCHRALSSVGASQSTIDRLLPKSALAEGWEDFRNASILQIADEHLRSQGINTVVLSRQQIAYAALGFLEQAGIRQSPAYHTTGSFTELTLDAVNKTLLAGYEEAPSSWETVFSRGQSVPDFKQIHRVRLGEVPNLDQWPDNTKPNQVSLADEKESYAVEAYSNMISFSWRLLVNDDMDALTRIPRQLGDAARRTVNAVAWSVITSNPNLQDGQPLFSAATGDRKKANLVASGSGSPTVIRVAKGKELMRLQVGVNTPEAAASSAILNLVPKYIVVPAVLENVTLQVVKSPYDPALASGIGYNLARELEVIVEPLLDANSSTKWYMFSDKVRVTTLEVTFLAGQETPEIRNWLDDATLAQNFAIVQSFAAKAIDFRGAFRDDGVA